MKEERILNVLGQVDEKYIEEAAPGKQAATAHGWTKWAVLAACLVLVLAGIGLPFFSGKNRRETSPADTGEAASGSQTPGPDLLEQLRQKGLLAETAEASAVNAGGEMPYIPREEMIRILKETDTVLDCTVEEINLIRVRAAGNDQTWSLTDMTLSLNGVIRGSTEEKRFRTVNVSVSNTEDFLSYPGLEDCKEGMRAAFVLFKIVDGETLPIGDAGIVQKDLGDYRILYCLEYDGECFRFMNYEIPLSVLN